MPRNERFRASEIYRGIFNIITGPGRISRSTRIVRSLAAYNQPLQARSSRSRKWAVCIIAMNVAPHDLEVSELTLVRREGPPHFSTVVLTRNGAQNFIHLAQVAAIPDVLIGT